jgi:hypothetical protein
VLNRIKTWHERVPSKRILTGKRVWLESSLTVRSSEHGYEASCDMTDREPTSFLRETLLRTKQRFDAIVSLSCNGNYPIRLPRSSFHWNRPDLNQYSTNGLKLIARGVYTALRQTWHVMWRNDTGLHDWNANRSKFWIAIFTCGTAGKVGNYGRIINANCRQKRKLFIPKSQYTAGGRKS